MGERYHRVPLFSKAPRFVRCLCTFLDIPKRPLQQVTVLSLLLALWCCWFSMASARGLTWAFGAVTITSFMRYMCTCHVSTGACGKKPTAAAGCSSPPRRPPSAFSFTRQHQGGEGDKEARDRFSDREYDLRRQWYDLPRISWRKRAPLGETALSRGAGSLRSQAGG